MADQGEGEGQIDAGRELESAAALGFEGGDRFFEGLGVEGFSVAVAAEIGEVDGGRRNDWRGDDDLFLGGGDGRLSRGARADLSLCRRPERGK